MYNKKMVKSTYKIEVSSNKILAQLEYGLRCSVYVWSYVHVGVGNAAALEGCSSARHVEV